MTLLVSSSRLPLSERSSPSARARVIATSPASFTSRSISSARTRSIAREASPSAAVAGSAALGGSGRRRAGRDRQRRDDGAVSCRPAPARAGLRTRRLSHGGAVSVSPFCRRSRQESDVVQIVVQRVEKLGRRRCRLDAGEAAFHHVRDLAQSHRPGHPRAALERVQCALQGLHRRRLFQAWRASRAAARRPAERVRPLRRGISAAPDDRRRRELRAASRRRAWASGQWLRAMASALALRLLGADTACSIGSALRSPGLEAAGSPTAASSRLIVMPCSSASATRARHRLTVADPHAAAPCPGAAFPAR